MKEDLKKQNHGVERVGDVLQIMPQDIHRMLDRLRKAVEEVIVVTTNDPKFMASAAQLPESREDEE